MAYQGLPPQTFLRPGAFGKDEMLNAAAKSRAAGSAKKDMAGNIIKTATSVGGGIIGGIYGGPAGAMAGASAGNSLGNAISGVVSGDPNANTAGDLLSSGASVSKGQQNFADAEQAKKMNSAIQALLKKFGD
tara:strand:+ start:2868 stop:3263 length:396 start_codon:yes stop_codon:yes gene_type:complete